MASMRSLTINIRIDDRNDGQEQSVLNAVRQALGNLPGEPRPTMDVGRAESNTVDESGESD